MVGEPDVVVVVVVSSATAVTVLSVLVVAVVAVVAAEVVAPPPFSALVVCCFWSTTTFMVGWGWGENCGWGGSKPDTNNVVIGQNYRGQHRRPRPSRVYFHQKTIRLRT